MKKIFYVLLFNSITLLGQSGSWNMINQGPVWNYFIDDESSLYLTSYPDAYKSTNFGQTWELIFSSQYPCSSARLVIWVDTNYIPTNRLIIKQINNNSSCTQPPVFYSNKDGLTWAELSTPSYPLNFAFTSFGDILVRSNSLIYRSNDEGQTWIPLTNAPGNSKLAVDIFDNIYVGKINTMYDPNIGYLYSESIYKSANNGNTWNFLVSSSWNIISAGFAIMTTTPGDVFFWSIGSNTTHRYKSNGTNLVYNRVIESVCMLDSTRFLIVDGGYHLLLTTNDGTSWQYVDVGLPIFSVAGPDSLGYVYVKDNSQMLYRSNYSFVPVELVSFSGNVIDGNVVLNWITATEINNMGFAIERKESGDSGQETEWDNIGFINGNGTTSKPSAYSFTDKNLLPGEYQYRLKQIDFDGSYEYSKVIEVTLNSRGEFSLAQNYPNPFNPTTNLSFVIGQSSFVTLRVYDVLGNEVAILVNEEKAAGKYNVQFNGRNLSGGIYFYKLRAGNFLQVKKMLLLK